MIPTLPSIDTTRAVILDVAGNYHVRFIVNPALKDRFGVENFYRMILETAQCYLRDDDLAYSTTVDGIVVNIGDQPPDWVVELADCSWQKSLDGRDIRDEYVREAYKMSR